MSRLPSGRPAQPPSGRPARLASGCPAGLREELARRLRAARSCCDPRATAQLLHLLHYYTYAHQRPLRAAHLGRGVHLPPNVSVRNGERLWLGDRVHVGERSFLWAGEHAAIRVGADALFGPEVFLTVATYRFRQGAPVREQPRDERDIEIGEDVWLGARAIVLPGVVIGAGTVVGAGSVVHRSLPAWSVAAGVPARVVGDRDRPGAGSAAQVGP